MMSTDSIHKGTPVLLSMLNSLVCGCVYTWIMCMCSVSKPCHIILPLPSLHNHPILSSLPSLAISQLSAQPRQRISSFEEARKLDLKNERMPPREDSSTSLPMATPPASPSKDQTFEDMNQAILSLLFPLINCRLNQLITCHDQFDPCCVDTRPFHGRPLELIGYDLHVFTQHSAVLC